MSFDIGSVQGSQATAAAVHGSGKAGAAPASRRAASTEAVKVDVSANAIPPSPPSDVLDAMGTAAAAHHRLAEAGRALSFKIDDATGKVIVTVHDSSGKVLFTVPGSKALDIASGGSLDH